MYGIDYIADDAVVSIETRTSVHWTQAIVKL